MATTKKGLNRTAVENFLGTLSGNCSADMTNARADARSYGWSSTTLGAIMKGIAKHYQAAARAKAVV